MIAKLIRRQPNGEPTLGDLFINDEKLFTTLEPPWLDNQQNISCIPVGIYKCYIEKTSPHFKYPHFRLENVDGRDHILIHRGNWLKNTLGCILVGDGSNDTDMIYNSKKSLKELLAIFPNGFELEVSWSNSF